MLASIKTDKTDKTGEIDSICEVSIAALVSICRVSEIDVALPLVIQGCSLIVEKAEFTDAQALCDRLHHYYEDDLFDFSDDEDWAFAIPAILDDGFFEVEGSGHGDFYARQLAISLHIGGE